MPANTEGQHIIFEEGGAWAGICVRIMDGRLQVGLVCCDAAHPPVVVVSTELPDTEDWIEIAAVFDKGKLSLYMNGKNVGEKQTEWPELVAHGQYGSIGEKSRGTTAFDEGEGFFVGGIDEFRVYRRALQPEEFKSTAVLSLNNLATTWGKLKKK
jgi:hypothetical protein